MNEKTLGEIEQMHQWTAEELRRRYVEVFGEEARTGHRQYLFRKLAWRLQSVAEGDLSERARRRAGEIANDHDLRLSAPRGLSASSRTRRRSQAPRLAPGTLLSRVFQGRTVVVKVLEEGFEYDGRRYGSLSAIAREISGTQWNGKVFFGVKRAGKP